MRAHSKLVLETRPFAETGTLAGDPVDAQRPTTASAHLAANAGRDWNGKRIAGTIAIGAGVAPVGEAEVSSAEVSTPPRESRTALIEGPQVAAKISVPVDLAAEAALEPQVEPAAEQPASEPAATGSETTPETAPAALEPMTIPPREEYEKLPWNQRPTASLTAMTQGCPRLDKHPYIYSIGSSTMATTLGRMLNKEFKKWGVKARRWGKPSTGLARPDYFDWSEQIPSIVEQFEPDIFIVSLGTNDNQGLREGKHWIRYNEEWDLWKQTYGDRVDRMLGLMSGEDRSRTVIWIGPTAFEGKRARRLGPEVNEIIRDRVINFDGPAYFVDAFNQTITPSGDMVMKFRIPGRRGRYKLRGPDNIHLTRKGVRWMMAEPVYRILRPCINGGGGHSPARTADSEG